MSERTFLPSSAKTSRATSWAYNFCLGVGVFVILVGAGNILTYVAKTVGESDTASLAFSPGVLSFDPAVRAALESQVSASSTLAAPTLLVIPSIGVRAPVESVGTKPDGSMATPRGFTTAGWYARGAAPGAPGNAIFAGHVNNALTTAGVFEHLSDLRVGEYITVSDQSGKALVYMVTEVAVYDTATAPLARIFATTGPSGIVLITCDGDWVASEHSFAKRLVVYGRLLKS